MERRGTIRYLGSAIVIVLNATMPLADAAEDLVPFEGLKEQFTIALPGGWNVYNQSEALSGERGPFGVVFFSAGRRRPTQNYWPRQTSARSPPSSWIDNLLERTWRAASFQEWREVGLQGWPGTTPRSRRAGRYRCNSFRNELNLAAVKDSRCNCVPRTAIRKGPSG